MDESGPRQPEHTADFKKETLCKIIEHFFKDDKTKLSGAGAELSVELVKVFVSEAFARSLSIAEAESAEEVKLEHLEKILPQLIFEEF